MRVPRLRFTVRRMMIAVAVIAMLLCGAMTGARWVGYYWRASIYATNERQWREMAARDRGNPLRARSVSAVWGPQIAEDYAQLTRKYRRAMWRPWVPVAPDPPFMYYPPRSP